MTPENEASQKVMADPFYIKQGSTLPILTNRFSANGSPITLTGSGVLKAKHQFGSTFEHPYEIFDPQTGDNQGRIQVIWTPETVEALLAILGTWYTEYHHSFDGGSVGIFPTEADVLYDRIVVLPSFAE